MKIKPWRCCPCFHDNGDSEDDDDPDLAAVGADKTLRVEFVAHGGDDPENIMQIRNK